MASLITGTWTLISSSAEIITGARRMTLRIHRLLQPGHMELCESDRRRLFSLQKRVECLVQPLNFLLLWSKQRDSCVQQVVLSAQELLGDVCGYVERFAPHDGGLVGPPAAGGGGGIDSDQLEYYLRELEFACASISMAVSIARASEAPAVQLPSSLGPSGVGGGVSLAALLRASRRIQEMRGRSGDLCTCPGRLYMQAEGSRTAGAEAAGGTAGCGSESGDGWAPVLSLAALKVVSVQDPLYRRKRYSIMVESRLPLTHQEGLPPLQPLDGADAGGGEPSQHASGCGMNATGPLSFPIEAALDARLMTSGLLALPAESIWGSADLGVDSLVLVWAAASSSGSFGIGTCAGDEASGDLLDAVLLPEGAGAEAFARWPAGRRLRSGSCPTMTRQPSSPRSASASSRYAFAFDGRRALAEPRAGEADVTLTPLDALYLARLCALDDSQQSSVSQGADGFDQLASCPPHLLSSDEVLSALLLPQDAAALPCGASKLPLL